MKIIEVISDTNIGGAGILLLNRLECTDLGKYPTAVCLPRQSKLIPKFENIGVECIKTDATPDSSWNVGDIKKFKRVFDREKPVIVNCHGSLSGRVAAKLSGVPVKICTRHCVYPVSRFEKLTGKINSSLSDAFIAVAHSARENLIAMGVNGRKIHVIINGAKGLVTTSREERLNLKAELGITQEDFVVCICARLEKCKGHKTLFRAVKLLKERGVKCVALVIGSGSQREELEKYCEKNGLTKNIIFVGFVEDVYRYMNISDLNINCSEGTETSSLALSEGMSIGLPAVVSDYGGNPYMVRHGENGYVYGCGDAGRLAQLICELMNDKRRMAQMSLNAKKRYCEELNAEAMTKKTNRLYDELLERHNIGLS